MIPALVPVHINCCILKDALCGDRVARTNEMQRIITCRHIHFHIFLGTKRRESRRIGAQTFSMNNKIENPASQKT